MFRIRKTILCTACAGAMLATAAVPASACDLTPDELFRKYDFTYEIRWSELRTENNGYYGYLIDGLSDEEYPLLDQNGKELDSWEVGRVAYIMDNAYRVKSLSDPYHPDYNCAYENGFYYAIRDDGTAIIAGCDYDWMIENNPTALIIPEMVGGAVVTEIAPFAFENSKFYMTDLSLVTIPDTVEVIRTNAFYEVFGLAEEACSINIPANVKYIGMGAYQESAWAIGDVIVLPESTEFVNNFAFGKKHPLIQMPESLIFTGDAAINGSGFCADPTSVLTEEEAAAVYVDGKYNVVTLNDAVQYQVKTKGFQKPVASLTGDLNGNGESDLADAVLLARALGHTNELTAEARLEADLNGDGQINADDLSALLSLISGMK